MSTGTFCHFSHLLQVSKKSLLSLILYNFFHDLIHVYSPGAGAGADSSQRTKFWCHKKCLVISFICCKFKKKCLRSLILYNFFHDLIQVYSPRVGADSPQGTKFWCQQKCLITLPIYCKFQRNLFKVWFYTIFFMIFYMYSTACRKVLIFSFPAWIFHFFHATKPPNSCGFCMELAGIFVQVAGNFLEKLEDGHAWCMKFAAFTWRSIFSLNNQCCNYQLLLTLIVDCFSKQQRLKMCFIIDSQLWKAGHARQKKRLSFRGNNFHASRMKIPHVTSENFAWNYQYLCLAGKAAWITHESCMCLACKVVFSTHLAVSHMQRKIRTFPQAVLYIAPGQGAGHTAPGGQSFDVNRNFFLSFWSSVASFKS